MALPKTDREFIDKVMEEGKDAENNTDNTADNIQIAREIFGLDQEGKGVNDEMPQFIEDYDKYDMPSGGGNFLKIEDGENRIRITTKALEVAQHERKEGGKYSTIICPGTESCELCKAGKSRKFKYAFLVLNRKDDKPYIYEAPITVFRQIVAYDTNKEYGDIRKYDITINKTGTGLNTVYTIMPSPKKSDLTDKEVKMIAESGVTLETAYNLNAKEE